MSTLSPFHERLTEAAGKVSYRRLGKLTETHPETVRRYMQGQTPSSTYVMSFCDALGVSGDWLLTGKGPKMRNEMRTHALKQADASELLNAIAETLTALTARVDTMERFMQSLETRLGPLMRGARSEGSDGTGDACILTAGDPESSGCASESDAGTSESKAGVQPDDAIERIRGAIGKAVAKRASSSSD